MHAPRKAFFDLALYRAYCSHVRIPAKEFDPEEGEAGSEEKEVVSSIPFSRFFGTQTYFHEQMEAGLAAGANTFIVLKCRQSGMTTDGLNVLPFLCFQYSGVQCAFITHSGPLLNVSRMMAKKFYRSIDDAAWRYPIAEGGDNKEFLSFTNESTIYWLNANSNDEGGLGRGLPIRCTWGDEIGSWTDEEGIGSLFSSLSERNPKSLHVFAGTSRGPNLFKELYEEAEAEGNLSQRAIFLGWWLHHLYEHELSDPIQARAHQVYWGAMPRLGYDEARWVEGVRVRYGFEIRPTQISWWRQHLAEKKKKNTALMYQEYPPLPEDAWIFGGSNFIDGRKLSRAATRIIESHRSAPRKYFVFDRGDGVAFAGTTLVEVDPAVHYYDLVCFAEPVLGERVRYAIGCDPAHGANPESDHACVQVLQCYSDKAIQVAEFLARQLTTKELAWVILHMAGAYSSDSAGAHLCIELQGGGIQTFDEIKRLQNEAVYGYSPELLKYFSKLTHYQYMRPDTNARGNLTHWETTGRTRPRMLNHLRDLIQTEYLDINSPELVRDCARITQLRDGYIEVPAQNHRVMAMACACMAYAQVQEMDIGLDARFSVNNLHAAAEARGAEALAPDEFMKMRLDWWRAGVMDVERASEVGEGSGQSWIAKSLGFSDDESDWY